MEQWDKAMSDYKRTTITLRKLDQENLERIAELMGGISANEAIRTSLSLVGTILEWQKSGGKVGLQRDGKTEYVRFF